MAAPVYFIMWYFLILLAAFCSTSSSNRTLKLTHVLFRHGNRSPIRGYPADPYQEDSWPQGFGQLTQEGMRQHYALGKWLRQRYVADGKLLNSTYTRTEVHVRSTAYDRTLMSAQSNLAGLYPPEGRQKWDQELSWQPIPVFTRPITENFLLVSDELDCPRLQELRKENKKLRLLEDYISKSKDFFDSLAKHAGFDVSNVTVYNFTRIADAWFFEMRDGRPLPAWATKDIVDRVLPILDFSCVSEAQYSAEYVRLHSGTLLNEIVTHFRAITEGTETTKMYMYSAHDDNVAWLLQSLKVFNKRVPPPASCVMVELYLEDDQSYTVDVLYKNNTKAEPMTLQMPGTKGRCTLEHFLEITKTSLLTDTVTACKARQTSDHAPGFLPKTWNIDFLPFAASQRAFQWLVVFSLLTIVIALASLRKGCKFLRNLNNNFKLRQFSQPTRPDV